MKKLATSFQAARRNENRHAALMKQLVSLNRTFAAAALATAAALGVFGRLEVTNVNFIFLLFAHITLS